MIEALFEGNAEYDFEPDPGAVVLWFTDDPSLNEQTRFRLLDAADRIAHSRLELIGNTFNQEKLESGKVYFLNAQKLGKSSLLVRGAPEGSQESHERYYDTLPLLRLPLPAPADRPTLPDPRRHPAQPTATHSNVRRGRNRDDVGAPGRPYGP